MPIAILDIAVIGVILISALLASVRGLTREVLAIVAWVVAAVVAWYMHPSALPYAQQYISNSTVALAVAIGAIFLGTLIIVSLITVKISDLILDSSIGAIDRTLGFIFGAARGFLICVIGWIFLSWLAQGQLPEWADDARTRPMLESTGDSLITLLPDDPEGLLQQFRPGPDGDPVEPAPDAAPQQRG
ncbi:MAG: CvpA family protein [Salinarimonadaceae bacterium]|nr:MAG: CvpA family protein [Salinarimonadaceae bacterium]